VVSFQLPNWNEWIVLHYGATRIGAILNPLIPIYREREVEFMVSMAGSKVLVIPREFRNYDYAAMVARIRDRMPSLDHVLVVDGEPGPGNASWQEFMATPWEERRDPAELAALRPDPNDVTLLIFTSGTTGEPKGVMHTHNTVIAATTPLPDRLPITSDTVFHMASTLAHLTGFLYGARLPVQNGATCVLQDVWDAATFVDLVETHRISYTSAATPFLHDLLSAPDLEQRDMSSMQLFCCMGAPIPRALVRRAKEQLPGLTVLGGWGQTENALVTLGIPGDPEDKIVGTDGYPWPGMQVRTVDADDVPTPSGVEGAVQVKGPFLFVGYCQRMEMSRASFAEDGWFNTGDLAIMDEQGYLKISGRTKDIIIRGGENIPVAYVENVMYEHPDVAELALVGAPDPRLQERPCLFVVLRAGAQGMTVEDVRSFLADKGVAKPYWPERVEVVTELPRTASGKIQKFKLRESLVAQAEATT
jgi:cyclohexanecarboxylate-CoA ligase